MEVGYGKVVSFRYKLKNEEGEELENNLEGTPQTFLFGRRNVIGGLEDALEGMSAGETISVTLPPEKAYGVRSPEGTMRIPTKYFVDKPKKLLPGMLVNFNTKEGTKNATVLKVGKFNVDVDTNHPLAGRTLTFDVELVDVREATTSELAHGHVHDGDSHHH